LAPTLLSDARMESRKFHHDKAMNADLAEAPDESDGTTKPIQAGPRFSVVILSGGAREELAGALNSAVPFCQDLAIRVFVVVESEALVREFGIGYPEVQFLMVAPGLPPAERRATGLRAASGDVVVFSNEGGLLGGGWRKALSRQTGTSHEPPEEPSPEWAARLTQRGVPGALGDS